MRYRVTYDLVQIVKTGMFEVDIECSTPPNDEDIKKLFSVLGPPSGARQVARYLGAHDTRYDVRKVEPAT